MAVFLMRSFAGKWSFGSATELLKLEGVLKSKLEADRIQNWIFVNPELQHLLSEGFAGGRLAWCTGLEPTW